MTLFGKYTTTYQRKRIARDIIGQCFYENGEQYYKSQYCKLLFIKTGEAPLIREANGQAKALEHLKCYAIANGAPSPLPRLVIEFKADFIAYYYNDESANAIQFIITSVQLSLLDDLSMLTPSSVRAFKWGRVLKQNEKID